MNLIIKYIKVNHSLICSMFSTNSGSSICILNVGRQSVLEISTNPIFSQLKVKGI